MASINLLAPFTVTLPISYWRPQDGNSERLTLQKFLISLMPRCGSPNSDTETSVTQSSGVCKHAYHTSLSLDLLKNWTTLTGVRGCYLSNYKGSIYSIFKTLKWYRYKHYSKNIAHESHTRSWKPREVY